MYAMIPWNDRDFFKRTLSNRVKGPPEGSCEGETLHKKLLEAGPCPYETAVGNIANKYVNGDPIEEDDVRIPFSLKYDSPFEPVTELEANMARPWHEVLKENIKTGDILYHVYQGYERRNHIADIVLDSALEYSPFGDERLFFQHAHGEDDYKYWPVDKQQNWLSWERCDYNGDTWDDATPVGVWPTDDAAAEDKYL